MRRLAVVLFNLGGPDNLDAVSPFLFNLFNDPAIIAAPNPIRYLLAKWISFRRAPIARGIYKEIGGASPLLPETQAQAAALVRALKGEADEVRAFIAMRYWHPMTAEVVGRVKSFDPDEIVLLPLYPQYSTTTTASSLKEWHKQAERSGLNAPSHDVCCYPLAEGFIKGVSGLVGAAVREAGKHGSSRVLFSAHGLPKKIVAAGDPYQWQVEQTSRAVVEALDTPDLDWAVCYQSRVGPLEWIGPSLGNELKRAGEDGVAVVVVPIAFVSEHSETLVELDIEYRKMAETLGVPAYIRVPALGHDENFITALAELTRQAVKGEPGIRSQAGGRPCPAGHGKCPL
ncbi:MAG: ferrochelatase [Rhodospirillales bacterium]|nr:ferrochelatase [Rhodospirillales bacterium]